MDASSHPFAHPSEAPSASPSWRPADFYEPRGDLLVCTLCPFACELADRDLGRCKVRRRNGHGLETATFATSVQHVHAIERKPLYHYRPGSRALTLAAPGCTFACRYCQNFRLSQYGRDQDAPWSAIPVTPAAAVARARSEHASIAFSYAEPTLAAEFTLELAPLARAAGLDVLWKTNGFLTRAAARRVAPTLAAVNVDLKAADETTHRRLTAAPLAPVLDAIGELRAHGVWVEISTPCIDGVNTEDASLRAMALLVRTIDPETPWHLLRVHPDHHMTDLAPTSPSLLARAREIARDLGLRHVYIERALGASGRDTCCSTCGATVIRRGVWSLLANELKDGRCPHCGARVAGRW